MPCLVCGNFKNNSKYIFSEMMFGFRDKFEYFQCSKCGCLQILNIPNNLAKYYPPKYYSFEKPTSSSSSKLRQLLIKRLSTYALTGNGKIVGCTLSWLMPSYIWRFRVNGFSDLKLNKQIRILDVGCGSGELLFGLAELGFKNVRGIDQFIESDIVYSNGASIRKATLEDTSGEYDLIMFQHSFEHMPNQLETLQSVKRLLAENGVCLLNMPTVTGYAWEYFRENWVQIDAPRHLSIHSQDSIRMLARKAGFKVSKVVYNSSSFQFWGSMQYQKNIPLISDDSYSINPSKSMFSHEQISEFERQTKELNCKGQGDAAVFYLKS